MAALLHWSQKAPGNMERTKEEEVAVGFDKHTQNQPLPKEKPVVFL